MESVPGVSTGWPRARFNKPVRYCMAPASAAHLLLADAIASALTPACL